MSFIKHVFTGLIISVFVVSGFLSFYFSPERSFEIYLEANLGEFIYDSSSLFNAQDAIYNLDDLNIEGGLVATDLVSTEGNPLRLTIPKIKVDAVVERMGVTPEGAMQVPKGPRNVGWFKFGPTPGAEGTAVITGHYGWRGGKDAVFDDLDKLKVGDRIYIEDDKGNYTAFIVRESRVFEASADPSNIFTSEPGNHLNLVTCRGEWDKDKKDYKERLVVFADLAL